MNQYEEQIIIKIKAILTMNESVRRINDHKDKSYTSNK